MPIIDPRFLDPNVHLFSNCPNCKKLFPVKDNGESLYVSEKNCPNCGSELNDWDMAQAALRNFITTQAISSANSITGLDLAIVIYISVIIFVLFIFPFVLPIPFILTTFFFLFPTLCNIIPIIICIRWLLKFGRWQFDDEEFIESKKKVKSTLLLWIVTHTFSLTMYLYSFWG